MTSQKNTLSVFTDAAAEAVAREIAKLRREAQTERDARVEREARDERIDAQLAALGEIERRLDGRLQTLKDGEKGEPGEPGKLPALRAWQDGVCYKGDVRAFAGATWQASRDTGKQPGGDDWILLAGRGDDGRDGSDGQSFRVRGTWLEINDYQAMDVVVLGGASFVAKQDEPGPCPGAGWQLLAAQGKRGNAGERGGLGPKGERGPAGLPVVSMSVSDEGLLTLTNGDGTTVSCDLYPVLARVAR